MHETYPSTSLASQEPVATTVKVARSLLGKKYKNLTDEQVENIIFKLQKIAEKTVENMGSILKD